MEKQGSSPTVPLLGEILSSGRVFWEDDGAIRGRSHPYGGSTGELRAVAQSSRGRSAFAACRSNRFHKATEASIFSVFLNLLCICYTWRDPYSEAHSWKTCRKRESLHQSPSSNYFDAILNRIKRYETTLNTT
jgi:hypothetical protein